MTRRDYHLASRPALVRATCAEIGRARDQSIAVSHVLRLGGTIRDHRVGHRPHRKPLRSQGRTGASVATAACLELIHQQQIIVAGQRGVTMRGRKRSRLGPPTRTADVVPLVQDASIDPGAQTDSALRALVRLLARQAAREVFEQSVSDSDCSFEEGRE
jgi:hypothetical protein